MKKTIAALAVVASVGGLTGCGTSAPAGSAEETAPAEIIQGDASVSAQFFAVTDPESGKTVQCILAGNSRFGNGLSCDWEGSK